MKFIYLVNQLNELITEWQRGFTNCLLVKIKVFKLWMHVVNVIVNVNPYSNLVFFWFQVGEPFFVSQIISHSPSSSYKYHLFLKVTLPIPRTDPYPFPTITSISDSFSPVCVHACSYFHGCNQCTCMTWLNVTGHYSLHGNGCI